MYTKEKVKACSRWLTVLLMLLLCQATLAQEKETPTVTLSKNSYMVTVGEKDFVEPTIIITDKNGNNITSGFSRTYNIEGGTQLTDEQGNVTKPVTWQDATTGTTVQERYGNVTIGGKTGTVTVQIDFTPLDAYADKYNSTSAQYTIQVKAPTDVTATLTLNGNTIADKATLNISTGKDAYNNIKSGSIALPELKLTYTNDNDVYDITQYYDIDYTLDDTKGGVFSLDKTNKTLTSTASNDAETTLTLKATPKADYASVYGDNPYTFTFPVKSSFISTDKKLKTYISFKEHVQEVYKAPGTFNYYIPVITDEHGNDITSLYKSNNTWNVSTQWNSGDLTYNVEFKNIYKDSENPYDHATLFAEKNVDYSSSENPGQIVFYNDGRAQLSSGADYVRPDDYVITVTAKAPTGYENIYDDPVVKDETAITTVTMPPYQGQPESLSRSYALKANQYVLNVMKNAPQIAFSPDPSKVKLAEKMEMTSGSRFDVKGYFPNVQAPTDSCLYEKNDFWYTYFVPDDLAWDSKKGDSQLTAETPVKVEVIGSLTDDQRKETNVKESIKQDDGTYKTMTGTRYWTQKQWGNENWKITFHGKGQIPLYYTIRPWNIMKWDVSSAQAIIYNIDEQEPVTLVVDPNSFVIHTGETAEAPSVKVYDQFGADLTEHYDFTYTVDNTGFATVDATDHHATGMAQGTATVTVTATEKNDWAQKDYYVDATPGTYTVKVVAADASPAQYEVIYDDVATSSTHTNRMGKLHFIKAGKFAAGQVAYQKVPGINITFGNPNDLHMDVVQSTADVSTGGIGKDNDNDNEDKDASGKFVKDVLVSNGHPTNKEGVHLMGGETDPIPTNGFFVKIEAVTNGFLTIDARFEADHTVYLVRESDKRTERFYYDSEFIGEQPFHYALMAGQTYYLYADGDQMRLHGLSFEPAFVLMPEDTDPYDAAQAFVNGYTGKLPYLRKTSYPTVKWQPLANEYSTSSRDPNKVATIDDNGKVTPLATTAEEIDGKSVHNRVKVSAIVLGEKKSSGDQVEKIPQYLLRISDIPIYMLTDDEDKPQVIPQPGQRVSTTNILTRMWMTYGGWLHTTEDYPYYKKNDKDAYPDLMYDGWKPAKMDSVGGDNRTIDGFKVASFGEQNPTAENVFSWNQNDKNTFALPVRGAYLKFEPEESGTLIVYLLQNGMTDAQESDTKLGDKYMLRRRAMYILDEAGHNVKLTPNDEWANIDIPGGTNAADGVNFGYYTESVFRCSWEKLLKAAKAAGNDEATMFSHSTWNTFNKAYTQDDKKKDMESVREAWQNATIKLGSNNRLLNGTTVQRVIKLSDGSYALPTKGYVRYALHVKSGKTYYFFMTGSKLGVCGYAFVPKGFTGSFTEWTGKGKPTTENGETNKADEANRKKLPEPGDEKVYNTESKTTPRYVAMTLYDNPTASQTNPEMTGDNAKAEFVNVTVNRSFQSGKWTGICLPFSVNETQVKQVFGNNAMVISFDGLIPEGEKKGWAHFSQHVNQLIEAGRPYFIKPAWTDDTSKSSVTFNHVSMEGVSPMTLDCVYNPNNLTKDQLKVFQYQFIGNYAPTQVPAYSYVMSANAKDAHGNVYPEGGLVRYAPKDATKKLSMAGFRSYLKPCKDEDGNEITTPAQAKMALIQGFEFDGTATGIDEIVEDMNVDLSRYAKGVYNLNGQLVSEKNSTEGLPSGVYIMNGKKIIVK